MANRSPDPAAPKRRRSADDLAGLVVTRSHNALERLAAHAEPRVLREALAAPTDVGGIALLLTATAAAEADRVDALAGALARGRTRQEELLARAGGALGAVAFAEALGISRQALEKRRRSRGVLALPSGSRDWRYPACQLEPASPTHLLPELPRFLRAFHDVGPWEQLAVLLTPLRGRGGATCRDLLAAGRADEAVAVAAGHAEHGA